MEPVKLQSDGGFGKVVEVLNQDKTMVVKLLRQEYIRAMTTQVLKFANPKLVVTSNYIGRADTVAFVGMDVFAGNLDKLRAIISKEFEIRITDLDSVMEVNGDELNNNYDESCGVRS
ncbi:unnamed protein product [Allacma fusca]|uniref:Uncharacterized protein n=1 Tax=Allacma fusca TaxID=39272 RepID=A0A8J2NZK0_9HEXA|nr:unnamed protein product [Allacma fusca]